MRLGSMGKPARRRHFLPWKLAVPKRLQITVICRSKMHLGLKRNFQVMPGAPWLELLCRHIPDRYEHLVRNVGWYSNRAHGERAKAEGSGCAGNVRSPHLARERIRRARPGSTATGGSAREKRE